MISNSRHVVAGIALTCDVKVPTDKLWILFEESLKQDGKIVSNFVFVADVMNAAMGKTSANWLINIKQV